MPVTNIVFCEEENGGDGCDGGKIIFEILNANILHFVKQRMTPWGRGPD